MTITSFRTVAVVALALLAVAALVWAVNREDPSEPGATGSAPSRNPTAGSSASAPTTSDYAPAPSESPVPDLPVQLEPVPLDETAEFGDDVSAELVDLVAVEVEGDSPGEISGPAIQVTVRLFNGTSQPLPIDAVTVFLYFGAELTPAPQISNQADSFFTGFLDPGEAAQGTYTFSVAEDERDDISVTVSHSPTSTVVVFNGALP
ncbi:MAG: hypothetical protein ACR2J5_18230 [Geodermatophilaceae bacterium]